MKKNYMFIMSEIQVTHLDHRLGKTNHYGQENYATIWDRYSLLQTSYGTTENTDAV